jgi:hypothetical protein
MTDFRALCARMADELDHYRQLLMDDRRATHALAAEARAALEAQPEPQGPTDEEIAECLIDAGVDTMEGESDGTGRTYWEGWHDQVMAGVRAVLARWDRPAIEPVPVSERLPGPEDCDAEGRCWFCTPSSYVMDANCVYIKAEHRRSWNTHWLPRGALPVPGVEGKP